MKMVGRPRLRRISGTDSDKSRQEFVKEAEIQVPTTINAIINIRDLFWNAAVLDMLTSLAVKY